MNKEICGEDENKKCDKLINRYLLRGKKFVDYACFQYGAYNVAISGKADAHFIDDFQYFVFTKSTKSLEAIRILLKNGKYEDVLIILRSMFEGYLASRFIDEKYDRNYNSSRANPELNNKMKKMFTEMRQSLKEKIGSVNKDFLDNM